MSVINKIMGPIFALVSLDMVDRSINTALLSPSFGLKIPIVAREAMSLTFTLLRLKISGRFTKGLPFGMGSIANFAIRLSGLQLALSKIGIFFDPANYAMPQQPLDYPQQTSFAPQTALPVQTYAYGGTTSGSMFNIGDFVEVTSGVDTGRQGSILAFNGSQYTVSGIQNVFTSSEIRRV